MKANCGKVDFNHYDATYPDGANNQSDSDKAVEKYQLELAYHHGYAQGKKNKSATAQESDQSIFVNIKKILTRIQGRKTYCYKPIPTDNRA